MQKHLYLHNGLKTLETTLKYKTPERRPHWNESNLDNLNGCHHDFYHINNHYNLNHGIMGSVVDNANTG